MQRNTPTKEALVRTLKKAKKPLSLSQIQGRLQQKFPALAFSTVYRTIKQLEKQQKVLRVDLPEHNPLYEWSNSHHHHLVCEKCGKMEVLGDHLIGFEPQALSQKTGFVLKKHQIEIMGLCPNCQHA